MSPTAPDELWVALEALRYVYPVLAFFYFIIALAATVCTLQTRNLRIQDQHVRRELILALIAGVTVTYLGEAMTVVIRYAVTSQQPEQDQMVYLMASTIVFGIETLALTDSKFPVWYPYYGTWFLGLVAELCLLIIPNVFKPPKSSFDYIVVVEEALRLCAFIALPILYFSLRTDPKSYDNFDAERQSLLRKKFAPKPTDSEESTLNGYGATTDSNSQESDNASNADSEDSWLARERKAKEAIEKRLQQDGNWFTYAKGFAVFLPYLWPVRSKVLQFRAVLVGCCLLAGNALNLLVPIWLGYMVKDLTEYVGGNYEKNIWLPVFVYALLGFLSGGACIGWIRRWLWMPIEQYSYDALSTASHAHIMSLSSDFHDSKTTSDLTQAINGGQSVASLVETVLFQIIPMFIDLAVAFGYLWKVFGPYMGLVMVCFVVTYLYTTTKLVALRAEKRRDYITIYRKEWTIGQQSLDGWNTASLFNMIPYERTRYASAVSDHMKSKRGYEMSSQYVGAIQSFVMTVGKVSALGLGAWRICHNQNDIGQFTTLIVYWSQLQSPLVFFSSMYRSISHSLMDAERLLELFQTKPTITDSPTAKPLKLDQGQVTFNDVSFSYDERKPTLKNVTFAVPAGKTVALVGETGGGKSTILKLIDRFYDVKGGSIAIDGQDIRDVTMSSLREKIGVVPQDPMLFNDSIMNNIRYARLTASDAEVYEACQAAAVHEKIMSFPDGYNSKVGDRGVKLSGGEKQRVAIARAILKRPDIILLDEATSAVDTETEQIIQQGLQNLCKGRTTFIVAHRLSTIMKADIILVVMNGEVVEEGSHNSLVLAGGKYHDLWSKQIFVTPAVDEDGKKSSKGKKLDGHIINDITDSKTPMNLAQALGKVAEKGSKKKSTPDTQSPNKVAEEYVKQMGYGEEQPFTAKLEAKTKTKTMDADNRKSTSDVNHGGTERQGGNHGHEGSQLKPEAPEFVPQQVEVPSRQSSTKVISKEAAKAHKKREKQEKEEQKRVEKEKRKAASKAAKKAANSADPAKSGIPRIDGAADESKAEPKPGNPRTEGIEEIADVGFIASGGDRGIKPKRKRYNRRNTSRSEPAGKAPDSSLDGTRDSESAQSGSGEAQASTGAITQQQMRRASAPSDPPVSRQERGSGRKRQKHWRRKNRTSNAEIDMTPSSGGGFSSEDVARPYPPLPSPAENAEAMPKSGQVRQPAKVQFALQYFTLI